MFFIMNNPGRKSAGRRLVVFLTAALLIVCAMPMASAEVSTGQLSITDFGDRGLDAFFQAARDGVPVEMLVGIWLYEGRDIKNPDPSALKKIASTLAAKAGHSERTQLKTYIESSTARTKIQEQMARMSDIMSVVSGKVFPLYENATRWYEDSWMAYRDFGGERSHEGVDIICDLGTPVRSMSDGYIEKIGWNTLGGWRIGIRGTDGVYYYYAHLSQYASGMRTGVSVSAGELIGYSGSTGYGPEGTDDMMIPHLHIGMYLSPNHTAVNPYPFLRFWEIR